MNMPMGSALPGWVTPLSWAYVAVALLSAAAIVADIYLIRRRHESVTTELVWITSALYLGPLAVLIYLRYGRVSAPAARADVTDGVDAGPLALATLPGGGASAVAHLVAVPLVAAVGWTIAGIAMWPMILVIAVIAVGMLALYERTSSRRSRTPGHTGPTAGAALFAAIVTVVAFDIGMVGWMLVLHVNDLMPDTTEVTFWFLMQVGVVVGLVTGYPGVRWLVARRRAGVVA